MSVATERHSVTFGSGDVVPALGLGTWHLGENSKRRPQEIAARVERRDGLLPRAMKRARIDDAHAADAFVAPYM